MNITRALTISVLSMTAGLAAAAPVASSRSSIESLSRADVKQSVLAARASGQLRPAGEAGDTWIPELPGEAVLSRAEIKHQVLAARSAGELVPAGEGDAAERYAPHPLDAGIRLSRADVKAETVRARLAGELVPAGEGNFTSSDRQPTRPYAVTAGTGHATVNVGIR